MAVAKDETALPCQLFHAVKVFEIQGTNDGS
jgi:hypothetical protein